MTKIDQKAALAEVEDNEIAQHFEYSVKVMRRLLQMIGMWPFTSATYPKVLRLLLIGVVCFLLMAFTIPFCLHMFIIVKDFQIRLRLIGPLSFGLMNIFKYVTVLLREGQLRECVEWMATDWRSVRSRVEIDLMLQNAGSAKTFTLICFTCMYVSGMSYSALFSFMVSPVIIDNKTTRVFAYPSYFVFFDSHEHFGKVYTLHAVCGFAKFTITCAVASVAIVCVKHVCGQIAVTSWMLRNFSAGSFDVAAFGRIIDKHLRAITFARKLEGYLSSMCLVELTGCCFNICMLGYYFITEHSQSLVGPYTYCMLLMSFTFNIFVFCYIGEQLTGKCSVIGNVAYNVDWYDFAAKDARNLLMMVASTQRPVVLTAGKMATLSMTCFSSVIKASFSYLNMLRTVTNS
ncbi:odorant receptor 13a-like [Phymastichus coffea]|uniref:odorant receptor 13a-like n=1 Tax=Phymastichus coffea TaxID=108790 RepID=UPI00273B98DD|nr:odorant receptor 13a-like [Phymastichus coffea]